MKLQRFLFAFVCASIAFCKAQHFVDKPCPIRPIQKNFDIVKVVIVNNFREDEAINSSLIDSTLQAAFGTTSFALTLHPGGTVNAVMQTIPWMTMDRCRCRTVADGYQIQTCTADTAWLCSVSPITFRSKESSMLGLENEVISWNSFDWEWNFILLHSQ